MSKFKVGDKVVILGAAKGVGIKHSLLSTGQVMCHDVDGLLYVSGDCQTDPNWWYEQENIQLKSEYDMQNKSETKRIPFDLERAKKGDKVINSNGHSVRIICFDRCVGDQSLSLVALHNEHGCEVARYHFKNGCETCEDEFDLFMAPVEKTGWITLYKCPITGRLFCTDPRKSPQESLSEARHKLSNCEFIITKQITWEE